MSSRWHMGLALAAGLLVVGAAGWLMLPDRASRPTASSDTAQAEAASLPSGQAVTLVETLWEAQPDGGEWLRLRYLAPAIAPGPAAVGFEAAADDMLVLCRRDGLALLQESRRAVSLIVVSLADRALVFGTSDPDAVQYFEAFRPLEGDCIWEEF